jgi:hypothetical protein
MKRVPRAPPPPRAAQDLASTALAERNSGLGGLTAGSVETGAVHEGRADATNARQRANEVNRNDYCTAERHHNDRNESPAP